MVQCVHARISQRDAEELFACLKKMDAIHDSVKGASMPGKPSVLAQCVEVYRAIENVLRKEMAAVERFKQRCEAEQGNGAPPDLSASGAPADALGAAYQGELGDSTTAAAGAVDPATAHDERASEDRSTIA